MGQSSSQLNRDVRWQRWRRTGTASQATVANDRGRFQLGVFASETGWQCRITAARHTRAQQAISQRELATGARWASEERRGPDGKYSGGAGTGVQGGIKIDLHVRGQPQALEDRVIVVELRSPLGAARGLAHFFEIGLVPKNAKPDLVQLVAVERIVVDPTR